MVDLGVNVRKEMNTGKASQENGLLQYKSFL